MELNVLTRYNIGDEVFIHQSNKVEKHVIKSIDMTFTDNGLELKYNNRFYENELLTKEEAFSTL